MANDTVLLKIITPEGVSLEKEIEYANFPGPNGELGVLPSHSPLLAHLDYGNIAIRFSKTENSVYFVRKGVLHVRPDSILLMVPELESKETIDNARAIKAKERALEHLGSTNKNINKDRAKKALSRAEKRLFIFSN